MSRKLTWADVAHYYGHNDQKPQVWLSDNRWLGKFASGYFFDKTAIDAADLPALRELSEITEEDAQKVMGLIKGRDWDVEQDGQGIDALFSDSDFSWLPRHSTNLVTYPSALHYLISRNYNVFGIETYKGGVE